VTGRALGAAGQSASKTHSHREKASLRVCSSGSPSERSASTSPKPNSDGTAQGQNATAARGRARLPLHLAAGRRPFTLDAARDRQAAAIELPLTGLGDNPASRHAVSALRTDLVPRTLGRIPGLHTAVTGATAEDLGCATRSAPLQQQLSAARGAGANWTLLSQAPRPKRFRGACVAERPA